MSTSSVAGGSSPHGSPRRSSVRRPARSRKPRRGSPARWTNPFARTSLGAEAVPPPPAAARRAAPPCRCRRWRRAGRGGAVRPVRRPRTRRPPGRRAARGRARRSPRRSAESWRARRPGCGGRARGAAPPPPRGAARSSLVSTILSAASTCARASSCRAICPPPASASTAQTTPDATAGAASPSPSKPSRIDQGSAIPVVSSTTTSGLARRATSAIAAHSSDCTRTSWQTQPPASSSTSPARLLTRRVSMSMRPSSLMITPTRRRCCAPSTRFRIVVLPAPRNPVSRTSGGLTVSSADMAGDCSAFNLRRRRLPPRGGAAPVGDGGPAGNASGTQARTAAAISGVGRSRSTAQSCPRSASSARRA